MSFFPECSSVWQPSSFAKRFLRKAAGFFRFCFCLIGVIFTIAVFTKLYLSIKSGNPVVYPENTVLRLSLTEDLPEDRPTGVIDSVTFGSRPTLADVITGLHRAAQDPHISSLIAYMPYTGIGLTQVQEIREAVKAFRAAGKKTFFYTPSFGELGGGMSLYYLAAAFDEIRMQPSGELGLAGISIETPYFKKALQKLGITPSFQSRYEYKSGADTFNAGKMSEPERQNMTQILNNLLNVIAADIGADRNIDPAEMKKILTAGPYFADQALALKLIDKIEYADVLENEFKEKNGGKFPEIVDLFDYTVETEPEIKPETPVIAYIPAVGIIQSGESFFGGSSYRSVLGSDTFSSLLREAADDEDVKAIVVRLDSPGGGYTPSDTIRREIEYVRKSSKKPIICSMGSTAASGGYFVSLGCDKVLADPSTLTGSIGVYGGKFVFKDLLDKLDITVSSITIGKNAGLSSFANDFTPEQSRFFNQSLDRIYQDFTKKVAERRNLSAEETDKVARGRVFTGDQAVKNGLIDQTGGIFASFETAAEEAGLKAPFHIVEFPTRTSRLEMLIGLLNSDMAVWFRKSILSGGLFPSAKTRWNRLIKGDFRLFFTRLNAF